MLKRACALLRGTAAFTLTEALATVIIVGLATSMLASGVALASKHLASSMALSESSMLYATLEQVLINELSYTNTIFGADNGDGTYKVTGFVSKHYIAVDAPDEGGEGGGEGTGGSGASGSTIPTYYLKMVDDSGAAHPVDSTNHTYGQLAMCDESGSAVNRLLGDSSYNYNVVACVKSLTFDPKKKLFIVSLSIAQSSDLENPLVDEVFTIRALNTVYLGDTALTTPGNSSTNNPHPPKPPTTPPGSTQAPTLTLSGISIPDNSSSGYPKVEKGYIYEYGGKLYVANGSAKHGEYASPTKGKIEFILITNPNPVVSSGEAKYGEIVLGNDGFYYIKTKANQNNSQVTDGGNWCKIHINSPGA